MKHPDQKQYVDDYGVHRFESNAIVKFLLDTGPFDMNQLAMIEFSDADRRQFAQLIGYSVDDWCDLSYTRPKDHKRVHDE